MDNKCSCDEILEGQRHAHSLAHKPVINWLRNYPVDSLLHNVFTFILIELQLRSSAALDRLRCWLDN